MPGMPDVDAVKAYIESVSVPGSSWTNAVVGEALAAEADAQARVCRVPVDTETGPADWPAALAEALKRRTFRNLMLRSLPLGIQQTLTETGAVGLRVGLDQEIRRYEAPFRKLVKG